MGKESDLYNTALLDVIMSIFEMLDPETRQWLLNETKKYVIFKNWQDRSK